MVFLPLLSGKSETGTDGPLQSLCAVLVSSFLGLDSIPSGHASVWGISNENAN